MRSVPALGPVSSSRVLVYHRPEALTNNWPELASVIPVLAQLVPVSELSLQFSVALSASKNPASCPSSASVASLTSVPVSEFVGRLGGANGTRSQVYRPETVERRLRGADGTGPRLRRSEAPSGEAVVAHVTAIHLVVDDVVREHRVRATQGDGGTPAENEEYGDRRPSRWRKSGGIGFTAHGSPP